MDTRFTVSAGALLFAVALTGCNNTVGTKSEGQATPQSAEGSSFSTNQKAYLAEAKCTEIQPHVRDCRHRERCVEVCHRPPGNPENEHTLLLPLAATKAHLHHGSAHHEHMDYLGPCGSNEESGDDSGGEVSNPPPSDPPPTDPPTDPTPDDVATADVPLWCAPFVEFDANCDGITDATGEPYL